jgi:hypothetical protein
MVFFCTHGGRRHKFSCTNGLFRGLPCSVHVPTTPIKTVGTGAQRMAIGTLIWFPVESLMVCTSQRPAQGIILETCTFFGTKPNLNDGATTTLVLTLFFLF